jgi:hypothetical protein
MENPDDVLKVFSLGNFPESDSCAMKLAPEGACFGMVAEAEALRRWSES